MLLPKEKPFLEGLNSYYLNLEKMIEHLQGEIGSGCIYGISPSRELLIYFDENEIIRCVLQEERHKALFYSDLQIIKEVFLQDNFIINIYFLDANAIFFWGQMPSFQRAKSALKSTEIPLPDLIFRLRQKNFSGFIDVQIVDQDESGLLFFNEGERVGGSYSWAKGGMSKIDEDYNTLLSKVQAGEGKFNFGSYVKKSELKAATKAAPKTPAAPIKTAPKVVNPVSSKLRPGLEEFLYIYIQTMQEKGESAPVQVLDKYIAAQLDKFPYLDPFMGYFEYSKGIVKFSADAPKEKIAKALIGCAWAVVRAQGGDIIFKTKLAAMRNKRALAAKNIYVDP